MTAHRLFTTLGGKGMLAATAVHPRLLLGSPPVAPDRTDHPQLGRASIPKLGGPF
jgi:hypothetical protein